MKRTSRAVIVLLFAALLGAGPSGPPDKISSVSGSPAPALYDTLQAVAEAAGFFREENLQVTQEFTPGAYVAAQLLAGGKADIASIAMEPVITGFDKGIRAKFFYERQNTIAFYVATLADSPIHSLADLRGKQIGVANMASAAIPITQSQLELAGLHGKDVDFVPVGVGSQALSALKGGQVQALALWGAAYAIYEEVNGVKLRYFMHPVLKDVGDTGYATTDEYFAKNSDKLARFARAIAKANLFILTNPKAAAEIFLKSTKTGSISQQEIDAVAKELIFLHSSFSIDNAPVKKYGYMNPKGVATLIDTLFAAGQMKTKPAAADIADNKLIDFANTFDHQALRKLALGWK